MTTQTIEASPKVHARLAGTLRSYRFVVDADSGGECGEVEDNANRQCATGNRQYAMNNRQ